MEKTLQQKIMKYIKQIEKYSRQLKKLTDKSKPARKHKDLLEIATTADKLKTKADAITIFCTELDPKLPKPSVEDRFDSMMGKGSYANFNDLIKNRNQLDKEVKKLNKLKKELEEALRKKDDELKTKEMILKTQGQVIKARELALKGKDGELARLRARLRARSVTPPGSALPRKVRFEEPKRPRLRLAGPNESQLSPFLKGDNVSFVDFRNESSYLAVQKMSGLALVENGKEVVSCRPDQSKKIACVPFHLISWIFRYFFQNFCFFWKILFILSCPRNSKNGSIFISKLFYASELPQNHLKLAKIS